jgi:hypothetical protein
MIRQRGVLALFAGLIDFGFHVACKGPGVAVVDAGIAAGIVAVRVVSIITATAVGVAVVSGIIPVTIPVLREGSRRKCGYGERESSAYCKFREFHCDPPRIRHPSWSVSLADILAIAELLRVITELHSASILNTTCETKLSWPILKPTSGYNNYPTP